jgi:threonine dehydrogenase-like Zn-dependent dehydrogenase
MVGWWIVPEEASVSEIRVPELMRAVVITAPRTCEVREVATPVPRPDEVLVQVEGCGVCGSNLPLWEGRSWFSYPAVPGSPGHEGWGKVVDRGSKVKDIAIGQRVAFLSERAFAEYDVAPAAGVVPLPDTLRTVPGEPLGCAINVFQRSGISQGQTVAVIGIGFLGALVTQLAVRAGAKVIAISQRPASLELAKKMGASHTYELDDNDDTATVKAIEEITGGKMCDRVIELVGLQRPLELAAKLCRVRGRLVIAGFHQDGPRQIDMFLWNWRGLDVINAHEREPSIYVDGMKTALARLAAGELDADSLYTHRVPLERAREAFEMLRLRPTGFVKALVTP